MDELELEVLVEISNDVFWKVRRQVERLYPGQAPVREIRWSNRMTRSAGVATKRRDGTWVISLSWPIFKAAWEYLSEEEWARELEDTVIHEVAHVIADGCDSRPHGPVWRAVAVSLGGTGERCHDLKYGAQITGASQFRPGQVVVFDYKGTTLGGRIVKKGPKRALVEIGQDQFRVPYQALRPVEETCSEN